MSAQILADWLCALGKDVYLLLRDIQRDADRDPRFEAIERRLASLLHNVDRLAELAEQDALEERTVEELLDDVSQEKVAATPASVPPRGGGQQAGGAAQCPAGLAEGCGAQGAAEA